MTDERALKRRRLSPPIEDENQLYNISLSLQNAKDNTEHPSQVDRGIPTLLTVPISPPLRKSIRKRNESPAEHPLSLSHGSSLSLSVEEKAEGLRYTQNALEDKDRPRNAAENSDNVSDSSLISSSYSAVEPESSELPHNKTSLQDASTSQAAGKKQNGTGTRIVPSPIELNRIKGLSDYSNLDTVNLQDIVGDPLIKECWVFNYLFDVDFLLYVCSDHRGMFLTRGKEQL